jgi:RNA polymerase sigma-70 factor (ECF subfamily)
MSTACLDDLLESLNGGDTDAAEEVFRAYEPYLRAVVRRQLRPTLRAKFDSMDVVQSVWADVLEGLHGSRWHFEDCAHLRAFLARLARNRFLDRCRKHRAALAREQPISAAGAAAGQVACPTPRPSEVAQGNELWHRMLALCPPEHQRLLHMKRQGLALAEMASRTGLHPSTIRRIFYELSRRVSRAEAPK